jgi:hypothetical protein
MTLTVASPFKYRHFSAIENYGNYQIHMKAEIGLLSRNIKIRGDDDSKTHRYGSHLMMTGKAKNGLEASISYT